MRRRIVPSLRRGATEEQEPGITVDESSAAGPDAAADPAEHPGGGTDREVRYLISVAGAPNYGDEILTRTWLRQMAARFPDADVVLDTPHPSGAQALLWNEHPRLRCVDTVWRLCWEAPNEDMWDTVGFVTSALTDHGRAPNWIPGLQLLNRAASVHVLGGGYVNDLWPRRVGVLAALAWLSRRGTPVALTGAGLMPLSPSSRTLVSSLLRDVEFVDFRDGESAAAAGRPDAVSGDDLWLADIADLVDEERAAAFDGLLCLQNDIAELSVEAMSLRALEAIRSWEVDPSRIAVVECVPRADRAVFDRLYALVPEMAFVSWTEVVDRGLPARPGQQWLSSRFHPHMVAARAGADGVALDVLPDFYSVKHASLLAAGSPWVLESADGVQQADEAGHELFRRNGAAVAARKGAFIDRFYGAAGSRGAGQAGERQADPDAGTDGRRE
ncbi:polysaccharide pyruvyl transferase family protein [Blastococcus sp. KM273128]|uniref:polysaccharide pyruvyl transferase family protein n=1 Tax=Blastococcus sp. KM273128 TaxID=2570314 RepID=UPI001F445A25|nr:polysaccharide pyruvyl transferase family protein [Blastococcus sp. KM273128]MCF6744588.1 polysaccharide pyruvyl transferase family protein [Blastococcus sp. KM273128]